MTGVLTRGSVAEESLGESALFFRNGSVGLELFRIDDREVEACLRSVIEEYGIDDFASGGWEPERDIRDAQDSLRIGDLLLDETD